MAVLAELSWTRTKTEQPAAVITQQLDRKLYEETAKVLANFGGKWNRSAKATVFDDDDAQLAVQMAASSGEYVDLKKTWQFFETPREIVDLMVDAAELEPKREYRVLEPSAGYGAIVVGLVERAAAIQCPLKLWCVEADDAKCKKLADNVKASRRESNTAADAHVYSGDFLKAQVREPSRSELGGIYEEFDLVLMNPPFSNGQDMRHIMHAFKLLKPGGRLVSILSPAFTFRTTKLAQEFRHFLDQLGADNVLTQELPAGSFKSSGTSVTTFMLRLDKPL